MSSAPPYVFAVRIEDVVARLEATLVDRDPPRGMRGEPEIDTFHERVGAEDWSGAATALIALVDMAITMRNSLRQSEVLLSDLEELHPGADAPTTYLLPDELLGKVLATWPLLDEPFFEQMAGHGGYFVPRDKVPQMLSVVRTVLDAALDDGRLDDPRALSAVIRTLEDAAERGLDFVEVQQLTGVSGHTGAKARDTPRSIFEGWDVFGRGGTWRSLIAATPQGPITRDTGDLVHVGVPEYIDEQTGEVHPGPTLVAYVSGASWARDGEIMLAGPEGIALVRGYAPIEWIREPAHWAARFGDAVVALRRGGGWHELRDGRWGSIPLPADRDARPAVARVGADGDEDVLLWAGAGWRRLRGEWQRVFALEHDGDVVSDGVSRDFYAAVPGGLARVRDGAPTIVLPCAARAVTPGPNDEVIVLEGHNREGRIGWIYHPADGRTVEIRSEHCGLENVTALAYDRNWNSLFAYGAPAYTHLVWRVAVGDVPVQTVLVTELGNRLRVPWSRICWPIGEPLGTGTVPEPTRLAPCWLSDDDLARILGGGVLELPQALPSHWSQGESEAVKARMTNRHVPLVPGAHLVAAAADDSSPTTDPLAGLAEAVASWRRVERSPERDDLDEHLRFDKERREAWRPLWRWLDANRDGLVAAVQRLDAALVAGADPFATLAAAYVDPDGLLAKARPILLALGIELVPLAADGTIITTA
jgi:hypothetical protein